MVVEFFVFQTNRNLYISVIRKKLVQISQFLTKISLFLLVQTKNVSINYILIVDRHY